jgi:ABC-2 type transport system permease protein
MKATDGFKVSVGNEQSELDSLRNGDRSVVVVFGAAGSGQQVPTDVYWDSSNPQTGSVALNAVQSFLTQAGAGPASAQPIAVTVHSIVSSGLSYVDFLVPGILAMTIMNSGILGLASAFVSYRERGVLRRIKATPFPLSSFIAARIVSQLVIAVVQAVILIAVGILVVGLKLNGNLFYAFILVIIGSLAFLSIGFVIASFARNQEAADSIANAVAFPMLFMAGVFFPTDAAPKVLQPIIRLLPLRYLADGLRNVMVKNGSLGAQWLNISVLVFTAAVGFALALKLFRWESSAV